ncbi:unnamed protein product [Mytilus edulis]|uniref:Uncharacterized protein n=1 Tax=Mytilus edulis TaxID=6550 RepID=A0A8S3PVM3_MYTED|nr:unnamed protein product [Mytilus edulis]
MPNKRNGIGSPSRAMGKKSRVASRTAEQRGQNEEIPKKEGRSWPEKNCQENTRGNESEEDARAFPALRHDPLHQNFEIANNSIDFTPSQESSIHDTVGEHVPFKIKEKIWEGKFIELHSLLRTQKAMEEVDEGDLKLKRGKICIEKKIVECLFVHK